MYDYTPTLITTMKTLLSSLLIILSLFSNAQCPVRGSGKPSQWHADSLKNRPIVNECIDSSITLSWLLGDSTMNENSYVRIEGYIIKVAHGGAESCNCKTADKSKRDTHIYIGAEPGLTDTKNCIVVELTPESYKHNLSYDYAKFLTGKKVAVEGYIFYDKEHEKNAVNTTHSPLSSVSVWRASCFELHPVSKITELQ